MKLGYKNLEINYGVQFTLATLPENQAKDFQKHVEKSYFDEFKNSIKNVKSFLYNPLKFYLLGDYDICYITLINNLKFSNRLFEPEFSENKVFRSHSFQNYSGFALNSNEQLTNLKGETNDKYFVGIINLKLNNGLLIGNGIAFFEYSYTCLARLLDGIPFLLAQTFTWFDFSLVVFIDDPNELAILITKIRSLELGDNEYGDLLEKSLFSAILKNDEPIKYSIFSDTHTHFGFNSRLIEESIKTEYIQGFLEKANRTKLKLETEIEWLVKPGHEHWLSELLQKHPYLNKFFDFEKNRITLGKYDLTIKQNSDDITSCFHLFRYILRNEECALYEHIRKVRTRIFLNTELIHKSKRNYFSWECILDKFAFSAKTLTKIEEKLKALKISRQIRVKISKIFINFNNGIQDPIQFLYFLDFIVFVKDLKDLVENARERTTRVKELEDTFNEYIRNFQEGYNVRFLNGYQFESISDFNLDFNSSIPQLLSSYSTLITEYGKLFYKNREYGQIIQLNNIDTQSNYLSINYSIHHLTSPVFVFSTISKEILNQLITDHDFYHEKFLNLKAGLGLFLEQINESYLDDIINNELFDVDYFVIDAIRYMVTFQFNFDLFNYWFWSYNFQNPSLFDTGGMFNEDHLRKEMLRIILIRDFFNVEKNKLQNPSPELFTYWDRHIDKIEIIAPIILRYLDEFEITKIVNVVFKDFFNLLKDKPDVFDMKIEDVSKFYMDERFRELAFENILKDKENELTIRGMIKYFYDTLLDHYELNNGTITMLRRSWETGKVLENFEKLYEKIFYAIDENGGVYFYDAKKMDLYFKMNTQNILVLLDFSLIQKKEFFLNHLNNDQNR
jgi:hypothetical protein